ncbi:helix-turn-helix transcriptional regulator [Paracidovorax citrulli]
MARALLELEAMGFATREGQTNKARWKAKPSGQRELTLEQSLALLTLRKIGRNHLPMSVIGSIEADFEAADRVLNRHPEASTLKAARAWRGKTARLNAGYPLIPPSINAAVFDAVWRALYNDESLDVTYRNSRVERDEPKRYRILPYAIVEQGPLWYLVVRNKRRSGQGTPFVLRLDRLIEVVPVGIDLIREKDFSLDEYVKRDKKFQFFAGDPVSVVLRVREDGHEHAFRSLMLSENQEIVEEEGGFILTATVALSVQFKNLMLEKCGSVEVLSPPDLRSEVVASLEKALARYADGAVQDRVRALGGATTGTSVAGA